MAFQPYVLVDSGIEVNLDTKELKFTLGPIDDWNNPEKFVTASVKLADIPKLHPAKPTTEGVVAEPDKPKKSTK